MATRSLHRLSGVEPDVRLLEHQCIPGEPRIEHRVFHDENVVGIDRVSAEGVVAGAVGDRKALSRLEPLALALDERDAREGNVEHALRHAADLVEAFLRWRLDGGAAQPELHQPLCLVLGDEGPHHFLRLRPQPAASHHHCDARPETRGVDRVVQHIVHALRQQIIGLALRACRRHDDDRHVYQPHHRARRVHDLPAVENRKLECDDQRVGRILRQNAERGRSVGGDLHGEAGFHQDVVEAHAIRLVANSQQDSRRLRDSVRIELGKVLRGDARRVGARSPATLELRVGNYFLGGGVAFGDVPQRVGIERVQSIGPQGESADLVGRLAGGDHAAQLRRNLEELDDRKATGVAGEPALGATSRLHVPRSPVHALLRGADHGVQLLDRSLVAAMGADSADETLGGDADETRRDPERLDADVGEARDRADRVVRMQRGEHEVSGHRGLERDVGRLLVTDFSDEQHVRILTQHRSQHPGEGETLLLVHLHLVDAAQAVFNGVFHGDDVHRFAAARVEGGVEGRRLSAPGRTGDEQNSLLAHEERLESLEHLRHEAERAHRDLHRLLVEQTHHDFFADARRKHRDAERHLLSVHAHFRATVLRAETLGDVQIGHDLDARDDRADSDEAREDHDVLQQAVDAEPHQRRGLVVLDVDVGSAELDGVGDDRVDELDDRRVHAQQRGFVLLLLLDLLDANGLVELFDEAIDHRVWAERLRDQFVQLPRWAEQRRHLSARRPAHALDRFLVERVGHGEPDHATVDFYGQHVVLPAKLLGQDLHRVLVDFARIQIDVVDSEGFLDDFGDFLEREDVTVDEGLRDVRLLLEAPTLDQLGRDAWHGPNEGDQPLVPEAESSLVGLWVSRYRHVFRWGTSVLLLYRWRAV